MSYCRWSDGNWYIYDDCGGFLSVNHVEGCYTKYNYGDDIEEYVENFPIKLSKYDKDWLRYWLKMANECNEEQLDEHIYSNAKK